MKKILSIVICSLLALPSAFADRGGYSGRGQNDRGGEYGRRNDRIEREVQRADARQDRYDRYDRRHDRRNDRRGGNIGGIIAGAIIGGIIVGAINDQRNIISCYAENQYGEIFKARGYNDSYNGYSVQNAALSTCYSYSYSCRPLGCQY